MRPSLVGNKNFVDPACSQTVSPDKILECRVSRTSPMRFESCVFEPSSVYGAICKPQTICDTVWNWADVHNAFTFLSMSRHVHWRPLVRLVFHGWFLRFIGRSYNYHKFHVRNRKVDGCLGKIRLTTWIGSL